MNVIFKRVLLFSLLIFSFNSNAAVHRITSVGIYSPGIAVGDYVNIPSYESQNRLTSSKGKFKTNWKPYYYTGGYDIYSRQPECPEGTTLESSAICEPPPPWCESDEVNQITASNTQSCTEGGGTYSFTCDSESKNYTPNCDYTSKPDPEPPVCTPDSPDWPMCADVPECQLGSPYWPACEIGGDPTSPLPPIKPPTPPVTEVTPPTEVDKPTGDDNETNEDLINAITSMNSDANEGIAVIQDGMSVLDLSAKINNDLLLSQIEQDAAIYENNKDLTLDLNHDLTSVMGKVGSELKGAIKGLGDGLDGIADGIDDIFNFEGSEVIPSVDGTQFGGYFLELRPYILQEIETSKAELSLLLVTSPLELGTPDFAAGTYSPIEFRLHQAGRYIPVRFSLFDSLGGHTELIRTVIIFMAVLSAGFLILSSGRKG